METREADKGVVEGVLEAKDALKVVESRKISSKFTAWYFCLERDTINAYRVVGVLW